MRSRLRSALVGANPEGNDGEQGSIVSRSQLKRVSERLRCLANASGLDASWPKGTFGIIGSAPGSSPASDPSLSSASGGGEATDGGIDADAESIVLSSGHTTVDVGGNISSSTTSRAFGR